MSKWQLQQVVTNCNRHLMVAVIEKPVGAPEQTFTEGRAIIRRNLGQGILDGLGVRAAVAYDTHAAHAQKRRSAIFRVVDALLKILKGLA